MEEQPTQDRLLTFFSRNFNLILIVILIFGFYLRFKFLDVNLAVWWDEGEYLSIAKEWAFGINYQVPSVRQPLLPFLMSIFYRLGIESLTVIKFFVVLVPSVASIYLTFLLGRELYNKHVGIISSFIMSVFWVSLFWSTRVSTDLLGLFFSLLAFYTFWRGYEKQIRPRYYLTIAGIALALGFTTRVGNILAILILGIYLLTTLRFKIIKSKSLRYLILFSLIAVIPYLIYNQIRFGNFLAFWELYFSTVSSATSASAPFFWRFFSFFKLYLGGVFFAFFLIGLATLYKLILGFDILLKRKNKELLADFFSLLMIAIPTIYFAFIQRQVTTEPRWAMIMAPAIFFFTAKGFLFVYRLIVKYLPTTVYKKTISVALITAIVIFGAVHQLEQSSSLIDARKDSYFQLKEAGIWIKENSNPEDVILGNAVPQVSYYSERKTVFLNKNQDEFLNQIAEVKPRFMFLTILEGYEQWVFGWPEEHQDLVVPVQAYFVDEARTQPILIIYQFIDYPETSNQEQ